MTQPVRLGVGTARSFYFNPHAGRFDVIWENSKRRQNAAKCVQAAMEVPLMPIRFCLLLFVFQVITLGYSPAAEPENPIRMMSYNIRYNTPNDGVNAWPNRKDHVAEMIGERYKADLAGLQEVLKGQVEDLESRLPDYGWFGVGRDDGKEEGEFCPIFYRKDRMELLDHGTFWLSETPQIPGSRGWDAACNRVVTWGKFKDREANRIIYHFNTHFDHRGKTARLESAKLLWRKVKQIAGELPTVVTGDFNMRESSDPYGIITGEEMFDDTRSDLKDARYASKTDHQGPTSTFTNWKEMGPPETKIDYIFVRNGVDVLTHEVLKDRFNGYYPSDHLPVFAKVGLD